MSTLFSRRTNPPANTVVTERRPRFEDTTYFHNTEPKRPQPFSPFYRTLSTWVNEAILKDVNKLTSEIDWFSLSSRFNATAAPYTAPVTSSPLFIVPMVLFFAVALIIILVLLFIRYQKRWAFLWGMQIPMLSTSSDPKHVSKTQCAKLESKSEDLR